MGIRSGKNPHRLGRLRCLVLCGVLCLAMLGIFGCGAEDEKKENTEMETQGARAPVGVSYRKTNGMTYGEDRDFTLTSEQTAAARWEEITAAFTDLLPYLKALPEEEAGDKKTSFLRKLFPKEEAEELDGPNETIFTVTWKNPDGTEETVRYQIPQREAFDRLLACMQGASEENAADSGKITPF